MALNSAITAKTGNGTALGLKTKSVQAEVDFSVNNLAAGDHFDLISLEDGHVVLDAILEIVSSGDATATLAVGVGGDGSIVTANLADAAAGTKYFDSGKVDVSSAVVSLAGAVVPLTQGVARVTLVVQDVAKF